MDICLPVCGGVWLNFFKNPFTIIGHFPYSLAGCFKKFVVIYFTFTIIGNFWHESWRSARNFFLTEENPFTIYGQQRVKTSYFSEKKYPSTIIGNLRHENWRSARNFFIKTKIFSLYIDNRGQKLLRSHYISSILLESFNCFAGVFRKIFYCSPTIIGNFHGKTSYFVKRKMPLYNKGTFDDGFYKVFKKKVAWIF